MEMTRTRGVCGRAPIAPGTQAGEVNDSQGHVRATGRPRTCHVSFHEIKLQIPHLLPTSYWPTSCSQ